MKLTDVNLYELFDAIRKQTGLRFLYNAEQMKEVPKVSVDAKQKKVKDVLTEVLAGTPLTYEYDKDVVTLVKDVYKRQIHEKVTFRNRYGITLAADMYIPKNAEGKLAAIAVSGPFGAVKEQSSGLYAQTLAERGFLTIAFDPSYTGESGGQPRYCLLYTSG